jgi:hypothetical protein
MSSHQLTTKPYLVFNFDWWKCYSLSNFNLYIYGLFNFNDDFFFYIYGVFKFNTHFFSFIIITCYSRPTTGTSFTFHTTNAVLLHHHTNHGCFLSSYETVHIYCKHFILRRTESSCLFGFYTKKV